MHTHHQVRVRRSLKDLQDDYDKGAKKPLEDLMRAWKTIKELPPDDPRSFFTLGGYHGEPFRGAGWGSSAYWGGYCNHGNILFPTWHRVYLVKLEEALQSVPGCEEVMLPYWDETSAESLNSGIPRALTDRDFVLDGKTIPNPLRSFVFTKNIVDNINGDNPNYSKPKSYETVRYPLSGLVGTPEDQAATAKHNAQFPNYNRNVDILNDNIKTWLNATVVVKGAKSPGGHVADKYKACLDAPNFTVFSNTSSAAQWNEDRSGSGAPVIVPLESPHNSIHLAVGGFDVPGVFNASPIPGANGDMGENDTAGLDPIFFFHHCFVDRVFWLWQKKHGVTDHLEIILEYPGTNSVDSQGATPGTLPNSWLTLESPLEPFKKVEHGKTRAYTSLDCINIEEQLGYTYGPGSLEENAAPEAALSAAETAKVVHVSAINRASIRGSFVIALFSDVAGKRTLLGTEEVLSRWSVTSCANCQTHLEVKAFFGLSASQDEQIDSASLDVEIHTHDGVLAQTPPAAPPTEGAAAEAAAPPVKRLYRLEVRTAGQAAQGSAPAIA